MSSAREWYGGRRIHLLTQHGKEAQLGPLLGEAIGCEVARVDGFDTDQLGTFTRTIARPGSQMEAARRKARTGMALAGSPLGLASEGAFVADPYTGMLPWNVEVVVFLDAQRGLELSGIAQGPARCSQRLVKDVHGLRALASEAGFPGHHLVVRPAHEHHPLMRKGLADWASLEAAFAWAQAEAGNGEVFVESDLRAHCNPTRQAMIRAAGLDLLKKMLSDCPACATPGYAVREHRAGLPCRDCGAPTRLPLAALWDCGACGHRAEVPLQQAGGADPARCDACNP